VTPLELLETVARKLDRLGLRYLVTGSIASSAYGEPRFTNDIDIVVELPEAKVAALCAAFPAPEYYVSRDAATVAARDRRLFNIIHPESGFKVDVIVPPDSDFEASRWARRRALPVSPSCDVYFAAPEDVILKKLHYFREGGSQKHVRDIVSVLRIRGGDIDRAYLENWVRQLGLETEWALITSAEDVTDPR
jgi:hypothetical protein